MPSREQVREIAERVAQRPVTPELLAQRDAIAERARAGDLLGVAHLLRQGMRCSDDKSRALAGIVLKLYANKEA